MEDEKIVRLLRSRNETGLELLMDKYQKFIMYLLNGILGAYPQDMEECLNDIRLKLWNGIDSYDEERSSFKTYITHIVRNSAIDKYRKINREEQYVDKNVDFGEEQIEHLPKEQSAEETVFNEEEKRMVIEAIKKLKKKEQELFVRRYYYMQSVRQIAEEMGRSEKTIEGRLTKIRKFIKEKMKEV